MSLTIEKVQSKRDLHAFVTFPWKIYKNDPKWVPPLIGDVKKLLSNKNPFMEHGAIESYLAKRNGKVVGRISAVRNAAHETFHRESVGFFGFFECIDDIEVARALMDQAKARVKSWGLNAILGPMSPSTNDECGLLVDGYDTPPMILMAHNPPYYAKLMEELGLVKAKDMYAYIITSDTVPERLVRGAKIAKKRNPDVVVRPMDKKNFEAEVKIFRDVYNQAWEKNWGFVPMTDAEIDHMSAALKPAVDPGLIRIAEVDGKPVGFALGLPDMNQAIRHANGRLFPFGLIKLLWQARKINQARIVALGLVEGYRRSGIDVILYHDLFAYGMEKGINTGEFSWILEDNVAMLKPLESMGASIYKTYRIYEGTL
ncbi:MAG: N-acetyltransferase [Candidatus Eisenbacteria bacterium]|uniref:N-acetyltransferase n=1 Tax=Eiseniibacteriota bacterium TaxID=2212470 RepID=A0A7Y2H2P9_UNCEI|nr:N-acetyltransferase [Candidatus Eisenbacteria bacterium]